LKDRERQQFGTEELLKVLSHYELGVIESITPFDRGSRASPKIGVVSSAGKFLLKKRAPRRRSERRVSLAHAIQNHLAERDFPLARLIATRNDESIVQMGEDLYELFEFVGGGPYEARIEQTREAGRVLGLFHEKVADFAVPPDAAGGSYHDVLGIRTALANMARSISSHDSVVGYETDLDAVVHVLYEEYDAAADRVNTVGQDALPRQVIHGDWHPGNMIFRDDKIVAVVDYDSCREAERAVDVANGLLHFSLLAGRHPNEWPDHADEDRLAAFAAGYRGVRPMNDAELRCIPHLMIEAMIAESVVPIARTGQFGQWTGFSFLKMVRRKVAWFRENEDQIRELVSGE